MHAGEEMAPNLDVAGPPQGGRSFLGRPIGRLRRHAQSGFGYLLVLFAVAALGLGLAGAGTVWETASRREKEAELLFVGDQFRDAIAAYRAAAPEDGVAPYPQRLEDLLEDPRFPTPRRHLRRIYRDPMTGGTDWGLQRSPAGIVGVYSRSGDAPLKIRFDLRHARFKGAARYDQWVFAPDDGPTAPALETTQP